MVGSGDPVDLRGVVLEDGTADRRVLLGESGVDLFSNVAVETDRVAIVGLEADVAGSDRVCEASRCQFFEEVAGVDLPWK
jgi:hypothetical protein